MRYHALATDYDGTLAKDGRVKQSTLNALRALKETGRRLILVTGRELEHLLAIFPDISLFERVVAENGAVIYQPDDKTVRVLAEPPSTAFVAALREQGVYNLSVGEAIVATWKPFQHTVLATIQQLGLDLQVIFNKDAVMILPSGVNKASGLQAALTELGLSPHNVVGVGDAENDHSFLALSECAVAVSNSVTAVRERCDWTTRQPRGDGVSELIDMLIADDLHQLEPCLERHHIPIGQSANGRLVSFNPYGQNILVCGSSGSGKSTLTTGLFERLFDADYQVVTMDPEGDYEALDFCISLGTPKANPTVDEVLSVLSNPQQSVSINMLGIPLDDRPSYFNALLLRLLEMRARNARPHWIIVDEAHHMLPTAWEHTQQSLPSTLSGLIYITVHPESVSPAVLETIDFVIAVGENPKQTILNFCNAVGDNCPTLPEVDRLETNDVIVWRRGEPAGLLVHSQQPRSERKRHWRKYAEGNLTPERSFYFRGPDDKLNLRANNLLIFLQMADGVDDGTWQFHLKRHDFSRWFAGAVRDDELAEEASMIESDTALTTPQSRQAIREIIERRYTKPAESPVRL